MQWTAMDAATQRWWVSYVVARLAPFANIIGYQYSWESSVSWYKKSYFSVCCVCCCCSVFLVCAAALTRCIFIFSLSLSLSISCYLSLLSLTHPHSLARSLALSLGQRYNCRLRIGDTVGRGGSVPPWAHVRRNECDGKESF